MSKFHHTIQRSRGFGFITFSSSSSLERVLAVTSHVLNGKKIDPKPATPKAKSKEAKTRKIFVGGVSQETSSEEVKKYFSQFGECAILISTLCCDTQYSKCGSIEDWWVLLIVCWCW